MAYILPHCLHGCSIAIGRKSHSVVRRFETVGSLVFEFIYYKHCHNQKKSFIRQSYPTALPYTGVFTLTVRSMQVYLFSARWSETEIMLFIDSWHCESALSWVSERMSEWGWTGCHIIPVITSFMQWVCDQWLYSQWPVVVFTLWDTVWTYSPVSHHTYSRREMVCTLCRDYHSIIPYTEHVLYTPDQGVCFDYCI